MQEWSPAKYNEFKKFLLKNYSKGKVNELVYAKIEQNHNLSYARALDEVVADSCEKFLTDSNAVEKIAELANTDQKLYEKVKGKVLSLVKSFREAYKGVDAESRDSKTLQAYVKDIDRLEKMWTEGVVEAARRYRKGGERNTVSDESLSKSVRALSENDHMQFQLKDTIEMTWNEQMDELFASKTLRRNDTLCVSRHPIGISGVVSDRPLAIPRSVITKAMSGSNLDHTWTRAEIRHIEKGLQNSYAIIYEKDNNALVYLYDFHGKDNAVVFKLDRYFDGDDVHQATSIHSKKNVRSYLDNLKNSDIYVKKNNEFASRVEGATQFRTPQANNKLITDDTLPQIESVVNPSGEKSSKILKQQRVTPEENARYMELAKDPEENEDELQGIVDDAAKKSGFRYIRNTRNKMSAKNNSADYYLFAEDSTSQSLEQYGENRYYASDKDSTNVESVKESVEKAWVEFAEENDYPTPLQEVEIDPPDIVMSAGVWDNTDFVRFLFERGYLDYDTVSIKTSDGLIVFDESVIKSADPVTYDDNGNVIPLSERFNAKEDDIRFQEREGTVDPESPTIEDLRSAQEYLGVKEEPTAREKLADAFSSLARTDAERNLLKQYQDAIEKKESTERELEDVKQEIRETKDRKKLTELRSQKTKLENNIATYDKKLLRLEDAKPLRDLMNREKAKARARAKEPERKRGDKRVASAKENAREAADRRVEKERSDAAGRIIG